jgi:hypothetical protein
MPSEYPRSPTCASPRNGILKAKKRPRGEAGPKVGNGEKGSLSALLYRLYEWRSIISSGRGWPRATRL